MTAGRIAPANRKTALIDRIRALLRAANYISFVELRQLNGFRGDLRLHVEGNENLIFWTGISAEAYEALSALRAGGEAHFEPCSSLLVYLADGGALSLPVAKTSRHFERPHWLPVTLCRGSSQRAQVRATRDT